MAVEGPSVALFGAVTCSTGTRDLPLPPGKPSLLLAVLALEAGHVVRVSAVIDAVWDEDPPLPPGRSCTRTSPPCDGLGCAGAPGIETLPGGYRLECEPQAVDVHRLLAAAGSDDPSVWDAALADSSEPLLGGVEIGFVEPWQVRVDAARDLLQERVWARRLDEGEAAGVLPELRAAVGREPLREDRVLLLARALGEAGQVDGALRTLDSYRRRLGEELGLDPSAAVPALRQDLLTKPQPPTPAEFEHSPAKVSASAGQRRKNLAILAAVVVVVIGSLVWRWVHVHNPAVDPVGDLTGPGLVEVDRESGSVVGSFTLPVSPAQIEAEGDVVWVRSVDDQAVAALDLDLDGDGAVDVTGLSAPPSALALDGAAAIVGLGFSGETVTVTDGQVSAPVAAVEGTAGRLTLASGDDGIWVATITGDVHAPVGTPGWSQPVSIGATPARLDVDGTRAWVLTNGRAELVALDGSSAAPVHSALRGEAVDLTSNGSEAWVVTSADDRLWRASETGRVVATRALPGPPTAVLATEGTVWVAISSPASVIAFDPDTLEQGTVVDLPREPVDLALVDGRLAVAVR